MIPVVAGMKPAVDAFRVASNAKIEEGQKFDPLSEMVREFGLSQRRRLILSEATTSSNIAMIFFANFFGYYIAALCPFVPPPQKKTYIKAIEMFAEAIPGVIIQLLAILMDGHASVAALASLSISALTTGFVSASISYDFDVSPQKRLENPQLYGYIPNNARTRAALFVILMSISALMLLTRALVIALLALASWNGTAAVIYIGEHISNVEKSCQVPSKLLPQIIQFRPLTFPTFLCIAPLGADLCFFLLYKIIRGDFYYWVPDHGCLEEIYVSLFARVVVKVITDFTSNGECCVLSHYMVGECKAKFPS